MNESTETPPTAGEKRPREPFLHEDTGGLLVVAITLGLLVGGIFAVLWIADVTNYQSTWQWWLGAYLIVGLVIGALGTLVLFCGLWLWCVQEGRFWGFAIGWVPSGFVAMVGGLLLVFLWLPAFLCWRWFDEWRYG